MLSSPPKYIIVGGEGGVSDFFLMFQSYSFGNSGPHAKFQNRSLSPSGLFLFSEEEDDYDCVDNHVNFYIKITTWR